MKNHSILICFLKALGACVLAGAPLLATAAASREQRVDATGPLCAAGTYEGSVLRIQKDLNRIYGSDDGFKQDLGEGGSPLKDGKRGPITLKWLGQFCQQHPFKVRAGSFDADVAAELARFRSGTDGNAATAAEAPAVPLPPIEATYRYDPAALRKPKDVELILPRLRALTDRYADKQLFDDAVRRALKGLVLNETTLQQIENFAAVDGYMLPSKKLTQLKGASQALVDKLTLKSDVDYASADDFHADLQTAVGEGPEKAELARYATPIDKLARVTHYQIPTTIAADLSAATELEPAIAALYKGLANIEYPSEDLLKMALRTRLEWALGMCSEDRYRKGGRLESDDFKALWAAGDGNDAKLKQVSVLRAIDTVCTGKQLVEANRLTDTVHAALFSKLDKANDLVKRASTPTDQSGPGAVPGCGCAHDGRDGMTYGFYPLWTNGTKADGTRKQLDFDVLSRIGLYGLTIDDKGGLRFPAGVNVLPWTLLKAAHRHMTKVDWVLYKGDWGTDDGAGLVSLFNNLEQSIDVLLTTPPPDVDWWGTALLTFGLERGPSAGDGITLRFEGFPTSPQAQQTLNDFVARLYKRLRAMKPARQLNIMVTQAEIADTNNLTLSVGNLMTMMQRTNPIDEKEPPASSKRLRENDLQVLVMMQEPTSTQKLLLRAGVESRLHSVSRVRMLRNVIPILEYDGLRAEQLQDDIIYFQDNFGGIGFWPASFATDKDNVAGSTTANHILHGYFDGAGIDGGFLDQVMDLICPNRRWLRWLAWISSIVAVWAVVKLVRCSGCGTRLDSNAFYRVGMVLLLILPFLLIAALAVGDPLFNSDSGWHWFLVALLIAAGFVLGAYRLLRPVRKLP